MEPDYIQKRMEEMQKSEELSNIMGRILSGKSGYKAVIETKIIKVRCSGCEMIYEAPVKFCSECGTKIEWPKKE
jgi:rRNA maturation endonuclease Nob1